MKLGLVLPTIGVGAGVEALDAAAAAASRLGWNSVWVTDHLLVPAGPEAEEYGCVLEATAALTWVAARNPDVRVGFSVLIPAMRDAPLLAKQLATIDVLDVIAFDLLERVGEHPHQLEVMVFLGERLGRIVLGFDLFAHDRVVIGVIVFVVGTQRAGAVKRERNERQHKNPSTPRHDTDSFRLVL